MIQECMYCQKVYGVKQPLSDTSVTHGICPKCFQEKMKELREKKINLKTNSKKGKSIQLGQHFDKKLA